MWRVDLYPISIYIYHLFGEHIVSYCFLSGKLRAGVFVFGGKIWHFQTRRWWNLAESTQLIFTTQDRWSVPSDMSWTSCRREKSSQWKNIKPIHLQCKLIHWFLHGERPGNKNFRANYSKHKQNKIQFYVSHTDFTFLIQQ